MGPSELRSERTAKTTQDLPGLLQLPSVNLTRHDWLCSRANEASVEELCHLSFPSLVYRCNSIRSPLLTTCFFFSLLFASQPDHSSPTSSVLTHSCALFFSLLDSTQRGLHLSFSTKLRPWREQPRSSFLVIPASQIPSLEVWAPSDLLPHGQACSLRSVMDYIIPRLRRR
jgi:hypothetical protein